MREECVHPPEERAQSSRLTVLSSGVFCPHCPPLSSARHLFTFGGPGPGLRPGVSG